MTRFVKHPALIVHTETPFNAGMPLKLLCEAFVTPQDRFFVRNHAPIPTVDEVTYRLNIGGMTHKRLKLSLDDLREDFPKKTLTATLQCAGNRRAELSVIRPIADQVVWDAEAIGNAVWGGVPLREVLLAAGVETEGIHVAFIGLDEVEEKDRTFGFGGSIPIEKGLGPEVLLAYEMNGEPLAPEHGAPLRAVIPGYIGARSVKWLGHIVVQAEASDNHFQARAYKIFPPHIRAETADWSQGLMLGELSVNSAICCPLEGETLSESPILVQGYAFAGSGRRVERVDVSVDGGETWATADLLGEKHPWAWRFWEIQLELKPGSYQITTRAWDSAANTQPEDARKLWNFKGYMNNAWHSVRFQVLT